MCGIAVILQLDGSPAPTDVVETMTARLSYRGPDGVGVVQKESAALGHRRLAIIDLSAAAAQPMENVSGTVCIAYNGEVYNFQDVRHELESLGRQFKSRSDTEVVLQSYEEWGVDCFGRLNGMFALAILDLRDRSLILARDRYGIKPLYYTICGHSLVFASEHKAMLSHPSARRDVDLKGLVEYLTFQNIFSDRTLLKGTRIFPPGCWARIPFDSSAGSVKPVPFWDYAFDEPEHAASDEEYLEELDRLFRQAVRRQLVSDVELGVYLSGGMDSGSITAVAASELPYVKSFTCGFDLTSATGLELACDERQRAESMSYVFKTEHYEMVLKGGDLARALPRVAWHLEEPRVGQSYPNYYAAQLASKFVKVVLSGTGGDELFGGYPWRYYRAVAESSFEDYADNYYGFWQRLLSPHEMRGLLAPVWDQVSSVDTKAIFRSVFDNHHRVVSRPQDCVNLSLYFEAKTFLHGLLVVEDKLSMAHGLETRVPFLDNDLVDFAMRVPVRLKLRSLEDIVRVNENEAGNKPETYYERTRDGKLLLRKAMERHVPPGVTQAVKQGFSAPDASWFRGDSIDYVSKMLLQGEPRLCQLMDRRTLAELVTDHLDGRRNRRLLIWSLLNLEWWYRLYIDGDCLPPPDHLGSARTADDD